MILQYPNPFSWLSFTNSLSKTYYYTCTPKFLISLNHQDHLNACFIFPDILTCYTISYIPQKPSTLSISHQHVTWLEKGPSAASAGSPAGPFHLGRVTTIRGSQGPALERVFLEHGHTLSLPRYPRLSSWFNGKAGYLWQTPVAHRVQNTEHLVLYVRSQGFTQPKIKWVFIQTTEEGATAAFKGV